MNTDWLEIKITTTAAGIDPLSSYLIGCDIGGLSIEDETDFQQFLEGNTQYWDYVDDALSEKMKGASNVIFYVTDDDYGRGKLQQIRDGLADLRARADENLGSLSLSIAGVKEEDWENNWKQYYKPLPAGEKLLIIPEWEEDAPNPESRIPLYLNPGLTFGTGNHASTQLCLSGLEPIVRSGSRVLDLGCGSGILAIASLLLGAEHAYAIDIDPKCIDVAYENAGLNGIGASQLTVKWGNVIEDHDLVAFLAQVKWDVVLANIVADVIIPLAPVVPKLLNPGGHFLCSGIIDTRAEEVKSALEAAGLMVADTYTRDGWFAFHAQVK